MKLASGFYIDSPSWPLYRAMVSYEGISTAPGNILGTTLVDALCSTAGIQPSYVGQIVKILSGNCAGQVRQITIHDLATGTITVAAPFTSPTGVVQQILASIGFVVLSIDGASAAKVNLMFNLLNAMLILNETGGSLLADGTEQTMVEIAAPMGNFKPLKIKIDCTGMAWGDTTVLRWYERIAAVGAYIKKDELALIGPQDPALRNIELEPNRHGTKITLTQTAGAFKEYNWEYLYEE